MRRVRTTKSQWYDAQRETNNYLKDHMMRLKDYAFFHKNGLSNLLNMGFPIERIYELYRQGEQEYKKYISENSFYTLAVCFPDEAMEDYKKNKNNKEYKEYVKNLNKIKKDGSMTMENKKISLMAHKSYYSKKARDLIDRTEKQKEILKRLGHLSGKKLDDKIKEFDEFSDMIVDAKEKRIEDQFDLNSHKPKHNGKNIKCCCPFDDHRDSSPSFYIYKETNSFYCYGCHRGGDVISFIREYYNISFKQAVRKLCE